MKRYLSLIPIILILTGCGGNASADFKAAGCSDVNGLRFDLAGKQFELAAENGDPSAVRVSRDSKRLYFLMTYNSPAETYEQLQDRLENIKYIERGIKSYCKNQ